MKLKKKKKKPVELVEWDDSPEEIIEWDDPEKDEREIVLTVPVKTMVGTRKIEVTMSYDKATGLDAADMICEIIRGRGTLNDEFENPEYLATVYHSLGNTPAWVLAADLNRWHQFVYAAEMLRIHPEFKQLGVQASLETSSSQRHAPGKDLIKTLGGTEEPVPIREQQEKLKAAAVESNKILAFPAPVSENTKADEAYIQKWHMAEKRAGQPRESWEGKADKEFEEMIKYCYGWLRDIGEVPKPYPMGMIDLFWQRPTPSQVRMDEKTVTRRNYITARVMKLWTASVADPDYKAQLEIGRKPCSYRVVLAAKNLSKYIELYATNWDADPIHGDDDAVQKMVRKAAVRYVNAHLPIDATGAKPGPLATVDPDYVDYIRLCRKYGLKEGVLLHKADI